jgi:hypothetical protein
MFIFTSFATFPEILLSLNNNVASYHNSNTMKLSKSVLQAILVAVTTGIISSCEKPKVDDGKKPAIEKPGQGSNQVPDGCPACGMG